MKDVILRELIDKWRALAVGENTELNALEPTIDRLKGQREGIHMCANALESLLEVLGDSD